VAADTYSHVAKSVIQVKRMLGGLIRNLMTEN